MQKKKEVLTNLKTQHPLLTDWPVERKQAINQALRQSTASQQCRRPRKKANSVQVYTYWSSERQSKNVVSGHLERRHGLVDILVQAVILHGVAGAQAVLPATTLSQEEDLKEDNADKI